LRGPLRGREGGERGEEGEGSEKKRGWKGEGEEGKGEDGGKGANRGTNATSNFLAVPWRGVSKHHGVIENVDFQGFGTQRLRHLRK